MKKLLLFFVLITVLLSCTDQTIPTGVSTNPTSESWRCGLIEGNREDIDVSGEWRAEINAYATDTLIVNNDGFFTQQFTDTASEYHYESELNRWYLEEVTGRGIQIHLEGMLDCGSLDRCMDPGSAELGFYDYCSDKWFSFDHDFILSLDGDSRISKGFSLRRMRPAGCEGCFVNYYFVEK